MFSNPIKLALVDDHVLFRKTLASYLSKHEIIDIVFEAPDAVDLISLLKKKPVDILLMDVFMPKLNGSEILTAIRTEYPHIRIIMLSMCMDIQLVNDLLEIGIHGYISKADEPEELLKAIKSASENRIHRNKLLTEALYLHTQNNIKTHSKESKINFDDREKAIIRLIWEEKNNREIADELFLSIRSIEKIRQNIKEKLSVRTTVGLLKYALVSKIINLASSSSIQNLSEARAF